MAEVTEKVVAWRRDLHAHPELGNREFRTAGIIAEHLRSLGMEVQTEVAHTGVVGILRGGLPGPVVALRADMDALPVTELVDLPFASKVTTEYNGQEVGVMHACGHDNHMAVLMGVAEVLAGMRERLPGTVKFIFQPAEEGAPAGEEGGASLMVQEGVLENPRPDAIFGLHVWPQPTGFIGYRAGGAMASSQTLTHQGPWKADPRRHALGGGRSRGGFSSDHHGPPDHRQPPIQHHSGSGRGHHRLHSWWPSEQHHSGQRGHGRHGQDPGRGDAGADRGADSKDRGRDRRERRSHGRGFPIPRAFPSPTTTPI